MKPEDAREWRPELVRDGVHEVRLQALALPELGVLILQLVMRRFEALGHLVEAPRQLADLAGACLAEADREVAGRELACAFGCLAHRTGDRLCAR